MSFGSVEDEVCLSTTSDQWPWREKYSEGTREWEATYVDCIRYWEHDAMVHTPTRQHLEEPIIRLDED